MITLKFKLDKNGYFSISVEEGEYQAIGKISHFQWHSDRVAEDIALTKLCKEGKFEDEDGETYFYIGFEGSLGTICVMNGDRAYLEDNYNESNEDMILSFEELLNILQQMYDYLKSIGM